MGVDETGRNGEPAGVDDARGYDLGEVADGVNLLANRTHVGPVAGCPGAVHDRAAGYDDIKHVHACGSCSSAGYKRRWCRLPVGAGFKPALFNHRR